MPAQNLKVLIKKKKRNNLDICVPVPRGDDKTDTPRVLLCKGEFQCLLSDKAFLLPQPEEIFCLSFFWNVALFLSRPTIPILCNGYLHACITAIGLNACGSNGVIHLPLPQRPSQEHTPTVYLWEWGLGMSTLGSSSRSLMGIKDCKQLC